MGCLPIECLHRKLGEWRMKLPGVETSVQSGTLAELKMAKLSAFLLLECWSHRAAHWRLELNWRLPVTCLRLAWFSAPGTMSSFLWAPTGIRKAVTAGELLHLKGAQAS